LSSRRADEPDGPHPSDETGLANDRIRNIGRSGWQEDLTHLDDQEQAQSG